MGRSRVKHAGDKQRGDFSFADIDGQGTDPFFSGKTAGIPLTPEEMLRLPLVKGSPFPRTTKSPVPAMSPRMTALWPLVSKAPPSTLAIVKVRLAFSVTSAPKVR